jgi:hypothetical protein
LVKSFFVFSSHELIKYITTYSFFLESSSSAFPPDVYQELFSLWLLVQFVFAGAMNFFLWSK